MGRPRKYPLAEPAPATAPAVEFVAPEPQPAEPAPASEAVMAGKSSSFEFIVEGDCNVQPAGAAEPIRVVDGFCDEARAAGLLKVIGDFQRGDRVRVTVEKA